MRGQGCEFVCWLGLALLYMWCTLTLAMKVLRWAKLLVLLVLLLLLLCCPRLTLQWCAAVGAAKPQSLEWGVVVLHELQCLLLLGLGAARLVASGEPACLLLPA